MIWAAPAAVGCGTSGSDLIDSRPAVAGRRIDAARLALPVGGLQPIAQRLCRGRRVEAWTTQGKQDFRFFDLGKVVAGWGKVIRPVQPQTMGQLLAINSQRYHFPAKQGRGIGKAGNGVTDIKLAIAKGTLAIFPGFAPHDAGQTDGQPRRVISRRNQGAAFKSVIFRVVMMQAIAQTGKVTGQHIGFYRM